MNETSQKAESFRELGIDSPYLDKLVDRGLKKPVPVQIHTIPPILNGHDVIVHSATGTGKTLAYLLPLIQKLDLNSKQLQILIIVPTQELAMQIVREIEWLVSRDAVAALIGGAAVSRQIEKLRSHPPIVVGTPGRLNELVNARKLKLHQIRSVVIDEVDQVFSLGSEGEVESIIRNMLKERQLIFVTATLTALVNKYAGRWMNGPLTVHGQSLAEANSAVDHHYMVCQYRDKIDMVRRLVRTIKPESALIFVNDTEVIGTLQAKLTYANLEVESLYGEAGKQDRAAVMQRFATGRLPLLIATDIAARGIDVEHINLVINFDPPADVEKYVHRSGRTGRMGRSGTIVTLVTSNEQYLIGKFSGKLSIPITEKKLKYGELIDAGQTTIRKPSSTVRKTNSAGNSSSLEAKASSKPDELSSNKSNKSTSAQVVSQTNEQFPTQHSVKSSKSAKSKKIGRDSKNKGAPRWLKDKDKK